MTITPAPTKPLAPPRFRSRLAVIFLVRTVVNTAHRIVYPFLPSIARGLGISLQAATGLVTLRTIAGLAAPLSGFAADRYGRRRSMEAGLVLCTLASLLLASGGAVAAAATAFLLYGFSKTLYDPAVHAYLGDSVPYAQRGRAVGIVELSWSAAWLLGVPASGVLIERFGWRAPWGALIVFGLAGLVLTRKLLPPARISSPPGAEGSLPASLLATWRRLLRRRPVKALLATVFLLVLANEIPFIVYGAWLESAFGLSLGRLGLASIAVGFAEAAAEVGTTLITDRLGKRRSVLMGLLGLVLSLAVLPSLSELGLAPAMAGIVLMMVTFEFAIVSLLPLASEIAPEARASLLALGVTSVSLGRIVGTLVGGQLWRWENMALHAGVGAICALGAAALLAWGIKEPET